MSSPAERFARARKRQQAGGALHPQLEQFAAELEFPLDDFQQRAAAALEGGRGVLVAAPTGAGKTVVGEFAVHLALATGRKAFYTTPIKALSNQKYADLARRYGAASVGLLTGDSSINSEAPIVVMTTEVLRNMMYGDSSTLDGLGFVVMDEVHYLADRFRGAVWEEVIIHLPQDVQVASLSATVSNAEEFGAWLGAVRGPTEVVVEEHRPVPLWQHMLVGRRLFDLFIDRVPEPGTDGRAAADQVNPELIEAIRARRAQGPGGPRGIGGGGGGGAGRGARRGRLEDAGAPRGRRAKARGGSWTSTAGGRAARPSAAQRNAGTATRASVRAGQESPGDRGTRGGAPSRAEVVGLLDEVGLLPAITFIFSRAGCDAAVRQLLAWDLRLVTDTDADRIAGFVENRVAGLATEDLSVLGYWDFLEGLTRGFAAHHAGMLPAFREIVEQLFTAGEIKCVFATETLALGINMPARTVVLEKLVKFNGESHADITPAEYTQLTGRAGRRGIDVEGHAVVLWHPSLDPLSVAGLASTRTYPLRSSFRPTYNMAVNLVERFGRGRARDILETSFAQFQADRAVVGLTRQIREHDEALAGYAAASACDRGDFAEYAALRADLSTLEKGAAKGRNALRREQVQASLDALGPGDVIALPDGRHLARAVIVAPSRSSSRAGEVGVITEDARQRRLVATDLDAPVERLGAIRLPKRLNLRVATQRRDLASTMRAQVPTARPP
ncbi:MAG: DEAD/DEAH box helicase, partial [Micrococcales bacterium]|nr:DEAD/DEAH box helicase [Micrococcales bacterium]